MIFGATGTARSTDPSWFWYREAPPYPTRPAPTPDPEPTPRLRRLGDALGETRRLIADFKRRVALHLALLAALERFQRWVLQALDRSRHVVRLRVAVAERRRRRVCSLSDAYRARGPPRRRHLHRKTCPPP